MVVNTGGFVGFCYFITPFTHANEVGANFDLIVWILKPLYRVFDIKFACWLKTPHLRLSSLQKAQAIRLNIKIALANINFAFMVSKSEFYICKNMGFGWMNRICSHHANLSQT